MYFTWMAREDELSAGALTLLAQSVSPNDNGRLLWDVFFPRENVDSVKVATITEIDFRPATDRREWNQRGRLVDLRTPEAQELEMVPIEGYFSIGEREIQELEERTLGNQELFREIIGANIPDRVDSLAAANYRRLEVDAFTAWSLGQITVMNPQSGATYVFDFDFESGRYQVASTPWADSTINAWDEFIAFLEDSINLIGPVGGAMLRLSDLKVIQEDAPTGVGGTTLARTKLADRVSQEIGSPFTFFVNENTIDAYGDAGTNTTREKIWPETVVAAVPSDETIGSAKFAPVARAFDISRAQPEAEVDIRGQTAFWETSNGGRELTVETQVNTMPIPNEQRLSVIDVG